MSHTPDDHDGGHDGDAIHLDVREIDQPFGDIVEALGDLEDGQRLELVSGFEPDPLYGVLEDRGFDYDATQEAPDEWHVTVEHA